MKKHVVLPIVALLYYGAVLAQQFEVPPNVVLNTPEDFRHFEIGMVQAYNWLLKTPLDQEPEKRKQVSAFFLKWLTGSPDVTVSIDPKIVTFMDCPDCMMIFMGGWTIHTLNNKYRNDSVQGATVGILAVIDFYEANKQVLGVNKAIEKYVRLKEKGKLEKYISDKMK